MPASDEYAISSLLFKRAIINFESGNNVVIEAQANSSENRDIGKIAFAGKPYDRDSLRYSELGNVTKIGLEMRSTPKNNPYR